MLSAQELRELYSKYGVKEGQRIKKLADKVAVRIEEQLKEVASLGALDLWDLPWMTNEPVCNAVISELRSSGYQVKFRAGRQNLMSIRWSV